MSKASEQKKDGRGEDELRPEYRLDYARAKPNRFADDFDEGRVVVVLDEDLAEVFRSAEAVKAVLRALVETMPRTSLPKKAADAAAE